jgi:hypothetical protein
MREDMNELDFISADPTLFFSTAAGPDAIDLYGPPQGTLDLYADGSPVAAAETAIANGVASQGSGAARFWQRPDVHALLLLVAGAAMVHVHMESN